MIIKSVSKAARSWLFVSERGCGVLRDAWNKLSTFDSSRASQCLIKAESITQIHSYVKT